MRNLMLFGVVLFIIAVSLVIGVSRLASVQGSAEAAQPPADASPRERYSEFAAQTQTPEPAQQAPPSAFSALQKNVPNIGSVQVWNGCGTGGAADRMAGFLRAKNFDVKDIGNAPTWNYPETMIISRTNDMGLANEIEKHLKTGKVVLIRNNEQLYDVTVVVGPDFEEKIK
jgi:hypothetical protein